MTADGEERPAPGRGASALQMAVIASLVGRGWPIVLGFLAVPFYLDRVGQEAYGLVGTFALLQAMCGLLDMGLGPTLTRELARAGDGVGSARRSRDLVRTLEIPYWSVAGVVALLAVVAAGPVASRWLKAESMSPDAVRHAAMLMGLAVAAQLPFALYSGGLLGLQRQVQLNALIVVCATVRVIGTVAVLQFVSPTIDAFFVSQLAASALQTAAGFALLWRSLPADAAPARFDGALLKSNLRFAAGVAGITVVSLALTQSDKIVLSRSIPLAEFGYYGIAASVAGALTAIAQPVFSAVFPRLSQRAAAGDPAAEAAEYHRASQLLSVLLFPVATVLACSSHALLLAWTGKPEVADHAWLPATMLVVGACLNGVMHIPFALMLSHGWTRLPLVTNIVAVVVLVPMLVFACGRYGAAGAASGCCVLNAGYVLIQIPLMHARLVPGEKVRWYVRDLAMPLVGAAVGAFVAATLIPAADGRVLVLARFGAMTAVSAVAAASIAPEVRKPLLAKFRRSSAA